MAVGQNRLAFTFSMGDAHGYVDGGLWPKEDVGQGRMLAEGGCWPKEDVVNFGGGVGCGIEHAQGADVGG